MFGWRRKSDGFEWQKYVRTTIKLRRQERAEKIDEIKQKAASGAKAAGRHSVSAGYTGLAALQRAAGAALRWSWAALLRGGKYLRAQLVAAWSGILSRDWRGWFAGLNLSGITISTQSKIAAMFGALGFVAGLSAYLQYRQSGADWSMLLATLVALVLLGFAFSPLLRRGWSTARSRLLQTPRVSLELSPRWLGAAAGIVVAFGAAFWLWQGGLQATSSAVVAALPSWSSLPSVQGKSLPDMRGRGRAITGDTVRIDGRLVHLAGIESPEISQVCRDKRDRAWRCGQSARRALRRILGRRSIVCRDVVEIEGRRLQATCRVGDQDIAKMVVEKGYAFAQGRFLKTYAKAEAAARAAKRGVWQGQAQRPAEYRARRWEVASKSAPDGCPIKGRIIRRAKVYVLPWALDYRQVRVRSRRGERWFCSEAEATAAGFRPSSAG